MMLIVFGDLLIDFLFSFCAQEKANDVGAGARRFDANGCYLSGLPLVCAGMVDFMRSGLRGKFRLVAYRLPLFNFLTQR